MIEIVWYLVCILLLVVMLLATDLAIKRVEAFRSRAKLIHFFAIVWMIVIGIHVYVAINFDFQYDGVAHLREATVVAEDISSGGFTLDPRNFLGNRGYRFYLAVLVEFGKAPVIVPQVINGVLGFLSTLLIMEAACVATNATSIPRWLLAVGWLAPSALLWLPLNLKEAIVVYGISALIRLFAYVASGNGSIASRLHDLPGVLGFLLLRPHICIVWIISLTVGSLLQGKSLVTSLVLLLLLAPAVVGSFYLLNVFSPELFSQAEETGAAETLGSFRDVRSTIGNTAIGGQSSNPIVSGLIITLFSSIAAVQVSPIWIIFAAEACLVTLPILIYAFSFKRLKNARRLPLFYGLIFVTIGMAVFLGFLFNIGLAVRQRLQVTPALLMLLSLFCLDHDEGEDDE